MPARTVRSVARQVGPALALISVPGPHAFTEAMDALDAGCDVLVFSDNVPVDHEVRLKEVAAQRGLLVMGPDCGTAVVGGIGLGFANVVQPGPVGLVAASGTGAQQLMCLLDAADIGVSAVLGVGGRDLSADVARPRDDRGAGRAGRGPGDRADHRALQATGSVGGRAGPSPDPLCLDAGAIRVGRAGLPRSDGRC